MKRILLTSAFMLAIASSAFAQKGVSFTASADHNDVSLLTGYKVIIGTGENPTVSTTDIAKPTPDATNTITYLNSAIFSSLSTGQYSVRVVAYGPGGETSSVSTFFYVDPTPPPTPPPAPPGDPTPIPNDPASYDEAVIHVVDSTVVAGAWQKVNDPAAASGGALYNPNVNQSKVSAVPVPPVTYFEVTFTARAGVPYHVWFRGKADSNSYMNDSVFVQYSNAKDANGNTVAKIGTSVGLNFTVEEGSSAGLSGWGWNDASYGGGLASNVYFPDGPQTIRVVQREDGIRIDQIVVSAGKYLTSRPGTTKNDTTILTKTN